MRVIASVGLLTLALGLSGCHWLGKRGPAKADPAGRSAAPRDEAPPAPPVQPASAPGGIIAGQVVDNFNHNPRATIEVVLANDGDGAPVVRTVSTDERGYFTIMDVKPGRPYQLIARAQDGTVSMAGTTWVQPPNARVVIRVSEDYNPPPAPTRPPVTIERPTPLPPGNGSRPAAEIAAPPRGVEVSPASPRPIAGADPSRIVEGNGVPRLPAANIPGPRVPPPPTIATPRIERPAPPAPEPTGRDNSLAPVSVTDVPSCVLTGKKLVNFALAGLDGQPYEFRRDRRGRLVLLDFWQTTCGPCRHSSQHHLPQLQSLYGRSGLEIIGIAYEKDPTFVEQVRRVQRAVAEDKINYRMLMGYGLTQCPVKRQFNVEAFPTLFLLDEEGKIIWSSVGLDDAGYATLKVVIRQKLGLR